MPLAQSFLVLLIVVFGLLGFSIIYVKAPLPASGFQSKFRRNLSVTAAYLLASIVFTIAIVGILKARLFLHGPDEDFAVTILNVTLIIVGVGPALYYIMVTKRNGLNAAGFMKKGK